MKLAVNSRYYEEMNATFPRMPEEFWPELKIKYYELPSGDKKEVIIDAVDEATGDLITFAPTSPREMNDYIKVIAPLAQYSFAPGMLYEMTLIDHNTCTEWNIDPYFFSNRFVAASVYTINGHENYRAVTVLNRKPLAPLAPEAVCPVISLTKILDEQENVPISYPVLAIEKVGDGGLMGQLKKVYYITSLGDVEIPITHYSDKPRRDGAYMRIRDAGAMSAMMDFVRGFKLTFEGHEPIVFGRSKVCELWCESIAYGKALYEPLNENVLALVPLWHPDDKEE